MRVLKYKTVLNDKKRCDLMKEKSFNYPVENDLNSPSAIYRMLCDVFRIDKETEECLYLLSFNAKHKLLGVFEASRGTSMSTVCGVREIFQKALLSNAVGVVIAHNHPSGDVSPSMEDEYAWKKMRDAGELIGVVMLDSVIVGDGNYYSFYERERKEN